MPTQTVSNPTAFGSRSSEDEDLAAAFRNANNAQELVTVLNTVLQVGLAERPYLTSRPIKPETINFYAFHGAEVRYRSFRIAKKTPGESREIKAPVRGLLRLQRLLLKCLTAAFTICDSAAHGFVPGRSVLTNALPHVGRRFVLNLDLKDFFASTSIQRVASVLQAAPFGLSKSVAHIVSSICCEQSCLPQGAPTSPLLTNAVCQRLDRMLRQLAKKHRCTYTRYADDLTFSSNKPVFYADFHEELNQIITAEGYTQNPKKQRLQTSKNRQEVTGIVVNIRPNVSREYTRQIRAALHNWTTRGYEAAGIILRQHYPQKSSRSSPKSKVPKLERVLAGKIAYFGMVRGQQDATYLTFRQKLSALIAKQQRYERYTK